MTSPVVELRGATLGHQRRAVLSDVSLTVERGELVGVLGVSGAGKTTLLSALAGGGVVMGGEVRVSGRDPREAACPIGLVPQATDENWGPLCVEEVVSMGRPRRGIRLSGEERQRTHELLDRLGLTGTARRRLYELSGGQRQRVAIARALNASRELILCDEPTSGADPALAADIVDTLATVAAAGTVVLVATHDLGVVAPRLDRVVGIAGGRVALDVRHGRLTPAELDAVYGADVRSRP